MLTAAKQIRACESMLCVSWFLRITNYAMSINCSPGIECFHILIREAFERFRNFRHY